MHIEIVGYVEVRGVHTFAIVVVLIVFACGEYGVPAKCSFRRLGYLNDIDALKSRNTYHKDLWLGLYEEENLVGILIGDIDNQIKEGSIEYLAVLPEYQNMGFGKKLVNHALSLMKGYAKICTVFSRSDNNYHTLELFKSCDFSEEFHWFVINKVDYDKLNK